MSTKKMLRELRRQLQLAGFTSDPPEPMGSQHFRLIVTHKDGSQQVHSVSCSPYDEQESINTVMRRVRRRAKELDGKQTMAAESPSEV